MDEEYQRMVANSIAHEAFCAGQAWQQAAAAQERPCVVWKPKLFIDGDQWCALLGENIQEGVVGFGDSPDAAMWSFDNAWRKKLAPLPGAQQCKNCNGMGDRFDPSGEKIPCDLCESNLEEIRVLVAEAAHDIVSGSDFWLSTSLAAKKICALPGAQPAQKAVAYLDLGVGGYMDVGTDLTDEALAALPKGRHMLGIVGTYGVEGYVQAQPAPSVPEGWKEGVEAVAATLQKKADDYAEEYGYDDMGVLSFGEGMCGQIKMDYYSNLIELTEEVRAMLAAAPEAKS